jgi:predicted secreted Zn-dependent protease
MRRAIHHAPWFFVWLVLAGFLLNACGDETNARSLVLPAGTAQAANIGQIPTTKPPVPTPTGQPKPTPTILVTPQPVSTAATPTVASNLASSSSNMPADTAEKDFKTTTDFVYYEINGATPGDLRAQMNQFGPTDSNGRRFDGRTDWYINWHYAYEASSSDCKIANAEVDVKITFTLPHWNQPGNISPALVEKWNKYMAALQKHEDGHKDNAVSSGQEILQAFKALPAYPDCDQVKQNVSATGQRIIKQANQKDLDYDAQTKHGATQGATFP